ncbi:TPA: sulfurtransferase-like selenium metabolism protein YedF, partial [Enterococcus faecalis]|nr:sulfurtransferase-like selenium metabolism protein YedF [Enterococcus faecalis]
MKLVDALGKPCPIPVIETKKALAELGLAGGTIEVLVDNEVAIENLKKL